MMLPIVNGYKTACVSCEHFDGDCHCALPVDEKLFLGVIRQPLNVVCERYQLRDGIEAEYQAMLKNTPRQHDDDCEIHLCGNCGHWRSDPYNHGSGKFCDDFVAKACTCGFGDLTDASVMRDAKHADAAMGAQAQE